MKLVDRTSGKTVDVADTDAQAAYQSGQYSLDKSRRVGIRDEAGAIQTIEAKELGKALSSGFALVPDAELKAAEQQAKHGGLKGLVNAYSAGANRALTFGASDKAVVGLGGLIGGDEGRKKAVEFLAGTQEVNPITSGVGEVAGTVAGTVGTLGLGAIGGTARAAGAVGKLEQAGELAGRALTAPTKAVMSAGNLAEQLVGHAVGETSKNALLRAAQAATKLGAQGAVEGALYGMGHEVSESALRDKDLTAEGLLSSGAHGAAFGGLLGAGLGGAGSLAKSGAKAIAESVSPALRDLAESQAWRSINAKKAFVTSAEKVPGGTKAVGRRLIDEGLIEVGDDVERIAPKLRAAQEDAGSNIGRMLEDLDAQGAKGPNVQSIASRVEKDVLGELRSMPRTNSAAINATESAIADIGDRLGPNPTFRQVHETRRFIDSNLAKWKLDGEFAGPRVNASREIRRILEDELEKAGEVAAKDAGKSFLEPYKAEKLRYRQLKIAADAAEDSVSRANANQTFSLTDKIFAAGGMAAGIASNPLMGLGGLATGVASKIARERGSSSLAIALDKAAMIGQLQQATQQTERQIAKSAAKFVEPSPLKLNDLASLPKEAKAERINTVRDRVREYVADPKASIAHAQRVTGGMTHTAPEVSMGVTSAMTRAANYLASVLPQERPRISLTPKVKAPSTLPESELNRGLSVIEAVRDPIGTFDRGELTPSTAEAIRTVYPTQFERMRTEVLAEIAKRDKPLTDDDKTRLLATFGIVAGPTYTPQMIRVYQGNYQQPQATPQTQAPMPTLKRPVKFDSSSVRLKGY